MVCILINTVVLALHWFMQPASAETVIEAFNMTFNVIFTIEAILKIYAARIAYFKEGWNLYDFIIVFATYFFLTLDLTGVIAGFGSTTQILRLLRIGRVIRLIKKAKQI